LLNPRRQGAGGRAKRARRKCAGCSRDASRNRSRRRAACAKDGVLIVRAQQAGGATATVSAAARWRCQGASARPPATPDDKFATTSSRRAPRTQQAAAARRFSSRDGAAGRRVSRISPRCARACRGTRAGARTGVEATLGGGAAGVEVSSQILWVDHPPMERVEGLHGWVIFYGKRN